MRTDDRLIQMIDLARNGGALSTLTDMQFRILEYAYTRRADAPETETVGFVEVSRTGRTRALTATEIARELGISIHKYKREMNSARRKIRFALSGN